MLKVIFGNNVIIFNMSNQLVSHYPNLRMLDKIVFCKLNCFFFFVMNFHHLTILFQKLYKIFQFFQEQVSKNLKNYHVSIHSLNN
jgi:hypothetical protein